MSIDRYSMHERQETHIDALADDEGLWVYWQDHASEVEALKNALRQIESLPGGSEQARSKSCVVAKNIARAALAAAASGTTTRGGGEA